jgi:hypothetical protein
LPGFAVPQFAPRLPNDLPTTPKTKSAHDHRDDDIRPAGRGAEHAHSSENNGEVADGPWQRATPACHAVLASMQSAKAIMVPPLATAAWERHCIAVLAAPRLMA